jgi:hypothetical protein
MRKKITKEVFKPGLVLMAFIFLASWTQAQKDYSKVYEKSYSGIKSLEVSHRRGPIEVLPSKNGQVSYKVELTFKANEEADAQGLINHFELDADKLGSQLEIKSDMNIKRWNSRNGNVRIEFSDGNKVKDIKDVKIKMQLFVPTLDLLKLENKYDDILIEQATSSPLNITLYSGRLKATQVNNKLTLDMKYSKGQIGNFKNAQLKIYDCDIQLGNGAQVQLESKYSEIVFGNLESFNANTYDDEIGIQSISGTFTLEDKYSELKIGSAGNGRLNIYDSELQLDKAKNIQVKSKYTTYRLGTIESLDFELSHDDEVKVKELGELSSLASKYTDYEILKLNKSVKMGSHDDDLTIIAVGKTFSGFSLEGKYTDVNITLDPAIKFKVEAYTKYGKLRFPENRFETTIHKEKNSELELKGAVEGAGESSPLFKINAYDCNISIK